LFFPAHIPMSANKCRSKRVEKGGRRNGQEEERGGGKWGSKPIGGTFIH